MYKEFEQFISKYENLPPKEKKDMSDNFSLISYVLTRQLGEANIKNAHNNIIQNTPSANTRKQYSKILAKNNDYYVYNSINDKWWLINTTEKMLVPLD